VRLIDPWDIQKRDMFCQQGFDVIVLKGKRLASGTEIRRSILSGNEDWRQKVPLGTVEVLEQWIGERGG
jgi:predicted nucleotidyltransferase